MSKEFCMYCLKFTNCNHITILNTRIFKKLIIKYKIKKTYCLNCNNLFYTEENINYNVDSFNEAYNNIYLNNEINTINNFKYKYNIKNNDIEILTNNNKDVLCKIINSVFIFEDRLKCHKNFFEYNKYLEILNLINIEKKELIYFKLNNISQYIVNNFSNISNIYLQKSLYFIQGFSSLILKYPIFINNAEAWVNGPVYKKVFENYKNKNYLKNKYTKYINNELSINEKEYIKQIVNIILNININNLVKITHNTSPWCNARDGIKKYVNSNKCIYYEKIFNYFKKICINNNLYSIEDIKEYLINL